MYVYTACLSTRGEPEVIRTPQCGHVICLACALRLRQQAAQTKSAAKCPVCSKADPGMGLEGSAWEYVYVIYDI